MPLWTWIALIVILSLVIGYRFGYKHGYEDSIIDISSIGVDCDAKCDSCENPCGLKYYVDISQVKIDKQ